MKRKTASDDTTAPSLDEFKAVARAEFAFLIEAHGFREIPDPHASPVDRFVVVYERAHWHVRVRGLSYGYSADVLIVAPDGRDAPVGYGVPENLWNDHREGFGRGQLGDIRYWAWSLRTAGAGFFESETAFFEKMWSRQEQVRTATRVDWQRRETTRAIDEATAAFRDKRYSQVVTLLAPIEATLSPAQKAKLEFARKRSPPKRRRGLIAWLKLRDPPPKD